MPSMESDEPTPGGEQEFGGLLREFRRGRRLSQLDLSLHAEVSQRHLSFLESGRARPSRDMVVQLSEALDLPLATRNRLLGAAGFAGIYPRRQLDAAEMAPVRTALERMMSLHEPFPALVVDRSWNLVMANRALPKLLDLLGGGEAIAKRVGGMNLMRMTLHPEGLRPYIQNFDEIATHLLTRAAHEAMDYRELDRLLSEVLKYPGLPARSKHVDRSTSMLPILPMQLSLNDTQLSLFTTLTTFGTPMDITTDELRIENLYPADEASDRLMRQFLA